jgi:hypothetical protein
LVLETSKTLHHYNDGVSILFVEQEYGEYAVVYCTFGE